MLKTTNPKKRKKDIKSLTFALAKKKVFIDIIFSSLP